MVEMDVQQRRARGNRGLAQRAIGVREVAEVLGVPQLDEEMRAGEAHAVALDEVILEDRGARRGGLDRLVLAGEREARLALDAGAAPAARHHAQLRDLAHLSRSSSQARAAESRQENFRAPIWDQDPKDAREN